MLEKILKIIDIINSCKRLEQLEQCIEVINNFERDEKPRDERIVEGLEKYYKIKLKIIPKMKDLLLEAWQYCDDNDKSTAFMIEYMQDVTKTKLDYVLDFIEKTTDEERVSYLESIQITPKE